MKTTLVGSLECPSTWLCSLWLGLFCSLVRSSIGNNTFSYTAGSHAKLDGKTKLNKLGPRGEKEKRKAQDNTVTNSWKKMQKGKVEIMGGKENDYSRKQQWKTYVKALFVLRHKEDYRLQVIGGTYGIFIPYDQQSFHQASMHSKERKLDRLMRLWFLFFTSIFLQLTVSFYLSPSQPAVLAWYIEQFSNFQIQCTWKLLFQF